MLINMDLKERSYDIVIEKNALNSVEKYFNLNRKVLIVTDDGVPSDYAEKVSNKCKEAFVETIKQGESSKSFESFKRLLKRLTDEKFTRSDCVLAVGGGVVGDLAGFTAASYMRGIDFYNIPTTLLSQIDSSIGGKTAINFEGIKNIVGAFYQPKKVLIDSELLKSLPKRQISNGLAEAIKMSLTSDKELFELIENEDIYENLDEIIVRSLKIKKDVVEKDEKEAGLRRILNFGHTIGHGIEGEKEGKLYHGECVALGMIPLCSEDVRERLIPVLKKAGLPVKTDFSREKVISLVLHDKKFSGSKLNLIKVEEIGKCKIEETEADEISGLLEILEEQK